MEVNNPNKTAPRTDIYYPGGFRELLEHVRALESHRNQHRSAEFSGFVNLDQALELAAHGWHHGLKQIAVNFGHIHTMKSTTENRYQWSEQGDFFDVGEYLSGAPEHWLERQQAKAKKVVRVLLNIGQRYAATSDQINRRGAITLALVQELQDAGFIVELEAVSYGVSGGKIICFRFPIRTTPVDTLELAFISGHPAMLRHLGFTIREKYLRSNLTGGQMNSDDIAEAERNTDIYIGIAGGSLAHYRSDETAKRWVEEQIKKQQEANR